MFSSCFQDIKPYVAALECMGAMRPDAILSFDRKGIHSTAIDAQHVVLMNLFFSSDDMVSHRVEPSGDQDVSFVADLKGLTGILKLAVKRGETIISKGEGQDAVRVEFQDSVFDVQPKRGFVSGSDIEVPDVSYEACIVMSTKEAKRVFKELSAIGGDLVIQYDNNKKVLTLGCDGPSGTAKMLLQDGSPGIVSIDGTSSISMQRYDAKMFTKIVNQKSDTGGKEMTIRIVQGFPIEVRHKVGDNGYVRFFLAPKTS